MRRLSSLVLIGLCGCGNLFNQHAQMMDAMRGVMSDTAARLGTSGTGQIAAGGQVINPGIRVAGGMEYYATATYSGVSGQVQAAMSGGLDRPVPPEVQARAEAIWRDSSLATAEKTRLVAQLLAKWIHNEKAGAPAATGEVSCGTGVLGCDRLAKPRQAPAASQAAEAGDEE